MCLYLFFYCSGYYANVSARQAHFLSHSERGRMVTDDVITVALRNLSFELSLERTLIRSFVPKQSFVSLEDYFPLLKRAEHRETLHKLRRKFY